MSNHAGVLPFDKRGLHGGSDPGTGASNGFVVRLRRLLRCDRGVAAIEFGLSAPMLLAMLVPVADLGLAFSRQQELRQAVQAGAQYAALHPWNQNAPAAITGAVTAATSLSGITVSPAPTSCADVRAAALQRQRDHDRELRQRLRERGNRRILRRHCGPAVIHPGSALLAARQFDDLERSVDDPHPVTARIMKRISGTIPLRGAAARSALRSEAAMPRSKWRCSRCRYSFSSLQSSMPAA